MTGPRNASTAWNGQRAYEYRSVKYPSVTTILSLGRPKEWMGPWTAKEIATCTVADIEGNPGVDFLELWRDLDQMAHEETKTHIERHQKKCSYEPSATGYLKNIPRRKRDKAADAGTERHDTLEAIAAGETIPEDAPGREQLEAWRDAYRPEVIESEAQVVHTKHGYAGSLDLLADIYGRRTLLDLKTSKLYIEQTGKKPRRKPVPRDWSLQLAAYRYAERIFRDDESWPMPAVDDCAILWVPSDAPEQWMFVNVAANGPELAAFLAAKHTHDDHLKYDKDGTPATVILPQSMSVDDVPMYPKLRVVSH